jgi:hypothetical protein
MLMGVSLLEAENVCLGKVAIKGATKLPLAASGTTPPAGAENVVFVLVIVEE